MLKIGEVAEQVGLSLRTIRFYDEEGLVLPETRTVMGFRLYTGAAVTRLGFIRRMKPLGFTVEQMGQVLSAVDALAEPATTPQRRAELDTYRTRVQEKAADLLAKAARGREFSAHLRNLADEHR